MYGTSEREDRLPLDAEVSAPKTLEDCLYANILLEPMSYSNTKPSYVEICAHLQLAMLKERDPPAVGKSDPMLIVPNSIFPPFEKKDAKEALVLRLLLCVAV